MGPGAVNAAGSNAARVWAVAMLHTKNALPIISKALRLAISRIQASLKTFARLTRANTGLGRAAVERFRQMSVGLTMLFQKEGFKTFIQILAARIAAMQTSAFKPVTISTHPQTTSKKTLGFQLFGTTVELSVSRAQPAQLVTTPVDTAPVEKEQFIFQEDSTAMLVGTNASDAAMDVDVDVFLSPEKLSSALAVYSKLDSTPPHKTRPAATEIDPSDTIPARRI